MGLAADTTPPAPPPTTSRHHFLRCATLASLLTLTLAALSASGDACPSASCLHAVGGGARHAGGAFPQHRVRSDRCWGSVIDYFESGAYDADVTEAATAAARVLLSRERPKASQVVVFDIDETVLSNRAEWLPNARRRRAWHARALPVALPAPQHDVRAAVEAAALRGDAPALAPLLALYKALHRAGFSLAFVTGRRDDAATRAATVANLEAAGYGVQCAETAAAAAPSTDPCYVALKMRPPGDLSPASVYKPGARAELEQAGFRIVGAIGDQFSDLAAGPPADASFKMPNPVYYIL